MQRGQVFMLLQNKRNVLVVVCLVFIFIIFPLVLFLINIVSQDPTVYHDPLSGEVIYSPRGRIPEKVDQSISEPIILGLSALLKRGISNETIEAIKPFFRYYSEVQKEGKEISIDVQSITHEKDKDKDIYSFTVRPDRDKSKDSIVVITLIGDVVERFVMKRNNNIFFDSKTLELKTTN